MTEITVTREFENKIQKALENLGKDLVEKVKTKAGSGEVAQSYKYRVGNDNVEIYSEDIRALYLEYGTGERGDKEFTQYGEEKKPKFTIPIKPVEKKTLRWVKGGKEVFARSTKGMSPQAPLRETVLENREAIQKALKEAFR